MKAGDVIAERFELERLAATGGMGWVYRARDLTTGAPVALKVLRGGEAGDRVRFSREAEILREIDHPAIVRHVAHGDAGVTYLAMEWIEGESLAERLFRGPLAIDEGVALARRVASALEALHARGIVHRDVKPSNLIVGDDGVEGVTLVDLGVARVLQRGTEHTAAGAMVGTPGYMAPEQARGEADVDARADVFALGAVLFECLTGREPFVGENSLAVLLKSVLEEAPRARDLMPEVPQAIDDLVASMLDKSREKRPRDGAHVGALLDALGAEVEAPAPREAPRDAITGAERRVVSLVVARRIGAVEDADETIPEGIQGPFLRRVREVAGKHGGFAVPLADGSVVVTFTSGIAASDLAASAARCAYAMSAILDETALAVVSGRALLQGRLPVGDLIDRAVAMIGRRASHGVDLDEVTAGLARGRFDVARDEGGMRLSGGRAALGAARTLLGKPTPCVGRDAELAAIEASFEAAVDQSAPRAVVITAPAGTGKSRLAYEIVRRLRARFAASIWIGRGDPMRAGAAFGVLAEALRGALDVIEGAPIEARRARVRARVDALLPEAEAARVTEFLGELVGAPLPEEASERLAAARRDARLMADQVRRAVIDFVRASCAEGPLVLVLEDLHHGDLPTVGAVDAALAGAHDLPLFVLAIGRPEMTASFPDLFEAHAPARLDLAPLARDASARLASLLLGSAVSEDKLARIVERADGNAFYLEELIRAAASGHDGAMPESVIAMAQARVEALAPDLRRALRAASVFGETSTREGIAALLRADVGAILDELVRAEVLTRRASGELVFRHALLREVAYGMSTDEDRARGHVLAGAWLESSGSRDAAVLAEHYERGGDRGRAATWYRRAAEDALDANDLAAVIARAERGLACAADDAEDGALRLLVAEASFWRGELLASMAAGEAAIAKLPRGGARYYRATGHVALVASRLARVDRVLAMAELLVDDAEGATTATSNARALALNQAIMGFFVAGQYDDADRLLGALARAAHGITDPAVRARTSYSRARSANVRGDLGEMLERRREAAEEARRADDRRMICTFGLSLGDAWLHLGAYAEAERELRVVVADAAELGLASMGAAARLNMGVAIAAQGRFEEGYRAVEEAARAFADQQDQACEVTARIYASSVLTAAGDAPRAAREARAALDLEADPPMRAYASAALAAALLAEGDTHRALSAAGLGHALLSSLGSVEEGESQIRLAWAEALFAAGDPRALGAIREARGRLLWRASKIGDPSLRRGFLERVAENARTLALARSWVGE